MTEIARPVSPLFTSLGDWEVFDTNLSPDPTPLTTNDSQSVISENDLQPTNSEKYKAVDPDNTISQKAWRVFKTFIRPFATLFWSGTSNMARNSWAKKTLAFKNVLTSTNVLDVPEINQEKIKGSEHQKIKFWQSTDMLGELKTEIQEKMALEGPHITFIHVACQKKVAHSTMLAIGKNNQGKPFAIFCDTQGSSPEKVERLQKAGKVSQLYEYLTSGLANPPSLLYSTSHIQADYCSCTAYSALFVKKLSSKFDQKDFSPLDFVKSIANHQELSFFKARHMVP